MYVCARERRGVADLNFWLECECFVEWKIMRADSSRGSIRGGQDRVVCENLSLFSWYPLREDCLSDSEHSKTSIFRRVGDQLASLGRMRHCSVWPQNPQNISSKKFPHRTSLKGPRNLIFGICKCPDSLLCSTWRIYKYFLAVHKSLIQSFKHSLPIQILVSLKVMSGTQVTPSPTEQLLEEEP